MVVWLADAAGNEVESVDDAAGGVLHHAAGTYGVFFLDPKIAAFAEAE